jgi:hypothetical protein
LLCTQALPPAPARRRVVSRRGALDRAYDVLLADIPEPLRPYVLAYAEQLRESWRVKSDLSTALTKAGLRWRDVEVTARELAAS